MKSEDDKNARENKRNDQKVNTALSVIHSFENSLLNILIKNENKDKDENENQDKISYT